MWDFDSPLEITFDGGCGKSGQAGVHMTIPRLKPAYCVPANGPTHPHSCDWGRGVTALAQAVDQQEKNAGVRMFSGEIACHHVDVLECAERSAMANGSLEHPETASNLSLEECRDCYIAQSRHVMQYQKQQPLAVSNTSRIVFGCARLVTLKDPSAMLDAAWSLGCTTFDLARVYGSNEDVFGKWLESRADGSISCLAGGGIARRDVVIIGKGGHPTRGDARGARLDADDIEKDLSESLRCLRTK
jgi:hypothetical protein